MASRNGDYDQNVGVAGVIYILENPALRDEFYKIGCSSRSGAARAFDLNYKATAGIPGEYACIFEKQTMDCGVVEKRIFRRMRKFRRGKWGQEFFNIDLGLAKKIIQEECEARDEEILEVGVKRIGVRKASAAKLAPTAKETHTGLRNDDMPNIPYVTVRRSRSYYPPYTFYRRSRRSSRFMRWLIRLSFKNFLTSLVLVGFSIAILMKLVLASMVTLFAALG